MDEDFENIVYTEDGKKFCSYRWENDKVILKGKTGKLSLDSLNKQTMIQDEAKHHRYKKHKFHR